MDEVKKWVRFMSVHGMEIPKLRIPSDPESGPWYEQSLMFRPSQSKFQAPRDETVEVVKISAPIPVSTVCFIDIFYCFLNLLFLE